MSTVRKIAQNTLYQTASKFIGTILGLITIGLMTRYLGQTGYGYYTTVVAFLQFFGVLADFGLQMTTNQMLSRPGADEEKIFKNIISIRLLSATTLLGLAAVLGWFMPYPTIVKWGITLTSLSFFFISFQSIFIAIFQRNTDTAKVAIAEVWGRVVLLLGVWLAITFEVGLLYILSAVVLSNFSSWLINFVASLKYLKLGLRFDWPIWKDVWHKAWPLAITIALTLVYFRADTIILSLFKPQNEVGIYGASYRVLEVLIQFPYMFLGLILPILTKFFTTNKNLFNLTIQKTFDFLSIIVIPMVLATVILGNKIMLLVAGLEFYLSGDLLKILIFGAAAIYFGSFFGYIIVAADLQKKMIKFYLSDAIISLILYFLFIPIYGYWAAAILTVFTEAFILLSGYYILKKDLKIKINFSVAKKSLLAALVMSLILTLLLSQNLITLVIIGLIVYFWMLYMLRGIDKNNVLEIINYR